MFSNQSAIRKKCAVTILVLCWSGSAKQVETQDAQHLLITEVSLYHPEFVEIYNPTDLAVSLSELWFCYYPANRDSWEDPWRYKQFPAEATIAARGHFLLTFGRVETGQELPTDWRVYSGKTLDADAGAIAILDGDPIKGEVVDAIGWGTAPLSIGSAALAVPEGSSLVRMPGTNEGSPFRNTRDNIEDFHCSIPAPSNSRSGVVLITNEQQALNREIGASEFSLCNASPGTQAFTIEVESEIGYAAVVQPTTLNLACGECARVAICQAPYSYYVVDLETTGGSPNKHTIIEAAWVYVSDGEVLQTDSSLIFFGEELDPFITWYTGITDEMLAIAPKPEAVIPPMLAKLEGEPVLSYSGTAFDRRFLEAAATSLGLDMPDIQWINVFSWIKKATPDLPNHSLQTVAESLGIEGFYHRALSDSLITNLVFQEAVRRLGSQLYVTIQAEDAEFPVGVFVLPIAPFD